MMAMLAGLAPAAASTCLGVAEPVIDVHVHSYERDGRFDARVPNPGDGRPMTVFTGADHARATAAALRQAGVVRAILFNAVRLFGWTDLKGCGGPAQAVSAGSAT